MENILIISLTIIPAITQLLLLRYIKNVARNFKNRMREMATTQTAHIYDTEEFIMNELMDKGNLKKGEIERLQSARRIMYEAEIILKNNGYVKKSSP